MLQQIAQRKGRVHQAPSQTFLLVVCLTCLLILNSGTRLKADSSKKVIQSSYSIENSSGKKLSSGNQSETIQTQFLKRKKKKNPEQNGEINFAQEVRVLSKGSSKRSAKKKALTSLPLNQLSPEKRAKANAVLRKISMYRELPMISLNANHDVYQFFLKNPEMAVEIWRVMGISKFQMWQVDEDTYGADAGDGSKGDVDVLHRTPTECLITCNGVYDSPFLVKPIAAKALMYLQSKYQVDQHKNPIVTHKMRLFISFPSQTVGTAARIISPVSNMIIDKNFHEVSLFIHLMNRSMSEHPEWVEQLAGKMDGVMDIRKQQLLKLTSKVYQENKRLKIAQSRGISQTTDKRINRKRTTALR